MNTDLEAAEGKLLDSVSMYEDAVLDRHEAEALLEYLDDKDRLENRADWMALILVLIGWAIIWWLFLKNDYWLINYI